MGVLNRALDLDGMSDSCYIDRLRVYPYGLTTRQQIAQSLPGHSVGIYAGRTDDVRVSNSFFLNGRAADLHAGSADVVGRILTLLTALLTALRTFR